MADALLRRYRPILHLHSSEASYPAHVEWYLERVSLWFNAGDDVDLHCVKEDIASPADLITTWSPKVWHLPISDLEHSHAHRLTLIVAGGSAGRHCV